MERKLKPQIVDRWMREKKIRLFAPEEFRRLFGVTLRAAQEFIKDHRTDVFLKLRNGLYALQSDPPHELEIANRLYGPSYVSLEYALAYHHMIPETVYAITSVTTKITRTFRVQGRRFEYSRIKRLTYTGYRLTRAGQASFYLARPEKALVDYCYFVDLKRKLFNDRLDVTSVKAGEAMRYAQQFGRASLVRLLRNLL